LCSPTICRSDFSNTSLSIEVLPKKQPTDPSAAISVDIDMDSSLLPAAAAGADLDSASDGDHPMQTDAQESRTTIVEPAGLRVQFDADSLKSIGGQLQFVCTCNAVYLLQR